MDQLQLDLVFLQETWQEPPQGSSESEAQFIFCAQYAIIEYTKSNQRRGIQFRVTAHLKPLLLKEHSHKSPSVEILTIQVCGVVFTGTKILHGQHWKASIN